MQSSKNKIGQNLNKDGAIAKLKRTDIFGGQFRMRLDKGNLSLNSFVGSLVSIILFLTLLNFAYLKADVLINKKDVDVLSTVNDRFFTPDDQITYSDNGFNIAAAFTAYDSDTEYILDATYGELVFKHYFWGLQPDGVYRAGRERIKSFRNCTKDELGVHGNQTNSKFYEHTESNQ